jgi:nucleoside-diphosphate-sugar epimerase
MAKILITGACGYLGAAVFETLRSRSGVCTLDGRLEDIRPGSLDCDAVIHCAGALRHRTEDLQGSNVEGTRRLLAGVSKSCRVIYISSKSVYASDTQSCLSEEAPVEPFDDYGRSKLAGEKWVMDSGRPWIILRAGTLFGLGVGNPGITFPSKAMRDFCQRREVTLAEPDVLHDYLYVWDLACLTVKLVLDPSFPEGIYNIAGPGRLLHPLIFAMADYVQMRTGFAPVIRKTPAGGSWFNRLDSSKLDCAIGGIRYTGDGAVIEGLGGFFLPEPVNHLTK